MHTEEARMLDLVQKKCEELKITDYVGGGHINPEHKQVRLLGGLIAYYEAGVEMRDLSIAELINALPEGRDAQRVKEIERVITADRLERQNKQGVNESDFDQPLNES